MDRGIYIVCGGCVRPVVHVLMRYVDVCACVDASTVYKTSVGIVFDTECINI